MSKRKGVGHADKDESSSAKTPRNELLQPDTRLVYSPLRFGDGVGRGVYVEAFVSDLINIVRDVSADLVRCIADYCVDIVAVTCVVPRFGNIPDSLMVTLTSPISHLKDMLGGLGHEPYSEMNGILTDLTLLDPVTGLHRVLHDTDQVGSLLHLSGFTWEHVLLERPTLHLNRFSFNFRLSN
jgi:hypothetical protein